MYFEPASGRTRVQHKHSLDALHLLMFELVDRSACRASEPHRMQLLSFELERSQSAVASFPSSIISCSWGWILCLKYVRSRLYAAIELSTICYLLSMTESCLTHRHSRSWFCSAQICFVSLYYFVFCRLYNIWYFVFCRLYNIDISCFAGCMT